MITIRRAEEKDVPGMLAIYNDIILNTTAVWHNEPHSLQMREEWLAVKKEQGFPVFIAELEERIIGFSTFGSFRPWPGYRFTVENSVYVAASNRGSGVGRLLMTPLVEAARAMQMHAIVAGIEASNEASIRLHQNFGFKEVAHFREIGYKFGRWLDLKFLQLLLS